MTRAPLQIVALALMLAPSSSAHDLFLKLDSYFLEPETTATLALINGTYDKSENVIARERMRDVSIVGPKDAVVAPESSQWWEEDDTTWLSFATGSPGTYVVGVSTRAREIELPSADFNAYLEHDGVVDMLEERRRQGKLGQDATELYSKHVKAIVQVGEVTTGAWAHRLDYPIEIVPLANPCALRKGDHLEILILREGQPVAGQLVYASYDGFESHGEDASLREAVRVRTDDRGVAGFELSTGGRWYVRLIHMVESEAEGRTHESSWATLTFEIVE